ncbi:heterokaryon incompatibility protein-domain-containing protein [Paraphoma chrysanthemicola]|nr:heterokaryon incompatibility protein-domain-containing protein [Paraphoma chrysanthemicola]
MSEDSTNEQSRTPFQHTPLDLSSSSIRLIEILPCSPPHPIRCRIRHATTDDDYACLSYVWGPAEDQCTILVDEKPFLVRRNLWSFLEFLSTRLLEDYTNAIGIKTEPHLAGSRSLGWPLFWIDAISIDQTDVVERSHQVQQMGSIYRSAQHVLGWLGDEIEVENLFRAIKLVPGYPFTISAMESFVGNTYWQRAWITQEIVSSKEFFFVAGTEALDIDFLTEAIQSIISKLVETWHRVSWQPALTIRRRREYPTLMENLWNFQLKNCFDPRDKVYSLIAISRDSADIIVDYDIPLRNLTRSIFRREPDFCLCQANMVIRSLQFSRWEAALLEAKSFAQIQAYTRTWDYGPKCRCCPSEIHWGFPDSLLPTGTSLQRFYYYCFNCDHSSHPRTYLHSLHGHLLLARGGVMLGGNVKDSVVWWTRLESRFDLPADVNHLLKWHEATSTFAPVGWDPDIVSDKVTVQISFLGFYSIAIMANGLGTKRQDIFRIFEEEEQLQLLRADAEDEENPRWKFL